MAEIEDRVVELERTAREHERRDEKQFASIAESIRDLRTEFKAFCLTITEAISGRDETPGIKERLRNLERSEQNRKWVLGILTTVVLTETVLMVLHKLTAP